MPHTAYFKKSVALLIIWTLGLAYFLAIWQWSSSAAKNDADSRLIADAGRLASQFARVLAASREKPNIGVASGVIARLMDDESVYAAQVEFSDGDSVGMRRNHQWEPIPWDDEIAEHCALGVNSLKYRGRVLGKVEVWLSARQTYEETAIIAHREGLRLFYSCLLWTLAFLFFLWTRGDLARLKNYFAGVPGDKASGEANNSEPIEEGEDSHDDGEALVSRASARDHHLNNAESWHVTAGMFRQTFGSAPALLNKLYAGGELAGLCHLGRIIEQAAPCVGAAKLRDSARALQAALNDPDNESGASAVEECAAVLEQTLRALGGTQDAPARNDRDPR